MSSKKAGGAKKGGGGGKKADQKKVQKIVEDRTFGLKNKNKSKKVQKYVQAVQTNVSQRLTKKEAKPLPGELPAKSKKQLKEEKAAEFNAIFKPVVDRKAQPTNGANPKSILCQYFKAGTCTRGAKCKFSHDLNIERKAEKIDIFTDRRELTEEEETMEDWDENKLRDVVAKKAGKNPPTTTDIICKYFLEAIESKKYGWFWSCPNGGHECKYRHALPPGFVFESKKKKIEEDEEKVPLEDLLEEERRNLKTSTPLTLEMFLKWKEDKRIARDKDLEQRKKDIKAGKSAASGRELFELNPELATGFDDDAAYDESELRHEFAETTAEKEKEEQKKKEEEGGSSSVQVDEALFAAEGDVEDLPEFDE